MSPAVNVLIKFPRISHITNRDIFQVNIAHSDEQIR